ncbi:MAG: matrixin family metalloprotease [Myxococcota bacterium]
MPRHPRTRATQASAILAVVTLLSPAALAYDWILAPTSELPMRWFREDVTVTVSTSEPAEVPWFKLRDRTILAFDAWNDIADCRLPLIEVVGTTKSQSITTPKSLDAEPDNVVVFIKTAAKWATLPGASPSTIALTFISHVPSTGEIIDADIAFNDAGFKFTVADKGEELGVDLLSAITHEAGHFLGMGHSDDVEATMYADYGLRGDDKIAARTLAQDDIDGVCALYEDAPIRPVGGEETEVPPPVIAADDAGCAGAGGAGDGLLGWLGGLALLTLARRRIRGAVGLSARRNLAAAPITR